MSRILIRAGAALTIVCLMVLVSSEVDQASGQSGVRQSSDFRFSEQRPGVPSGITLDIDYVNPADPGGKPPAVRTVIEALAPGAGIDTSIPEQCGASDAELMLQGAGACPTASRVGTGTIVIDTGLPEPARFLNVDVTFINNAGELIFLSTERSSGARVVSRSPIEGRTIVNSAPTLPGTLPDGAALDVVHAKLDPISREIGGVRRGYITTPAECPAIGTWTNSIQFTYFDGVSQAVDSGSPCASAASRSGRCANLWSGGSGADRYVGTPRGDRVFGLGGPDRLLGRRGADCLRGQRGGDDLGGGRGADRVQGGSGGDRLSGGRGRDLLTGSRGSDSIHARDGGRDVIRCGPGHDQVWADPVDRVARSCERLMS